MYDIHISSTDEYAANVIAAKQARADGMPECAKRHDEMALHLQNAQRWAQANCPPGYRISTTIRFDFVPAVNPVYNGSRGNIYSHDKKET